MEELTIKEPDWEMYYDDHSAYDFNKAFGQWFKENVEPVNQMLRSAKEIYSVDAGNLEGHWAEDMKNLPYEDPSKKALLINIQPVKEKTAQEILSCIYHGVNNGRYRNMDELWDVLKSKAYLVVES